METREKSLQVHLSDSEREALRRQAAAHGLKMGQYIRQLIRLAAERNKEAK